MIIARLEALIKTSATYIAPNISSESQMARKRRHQLMTVIRANDNDVSLVAPTTRQKHEVRYTSCRAAVVYAVVYSLVTSTNA